jgi:hypothetical protein
MKLKIQQILLAIPFVCLIKISSSKFPPLEYPKLHLDVIASFITKAGIIQTIRLTTFNHSNHDSELLSSLCFKNFVVTIESFDQTSKAEIRKSDLMLFQLHSDGNFNSITKHLYNKSFYFDGKVVILTSNQSKVDLEKVFGAFWRNFMFDVDVLSIDESSQTAQLLTFMPFNGTCDNTSPVKINEFDGATMQWSTDAFFPKKFENLQNCPIRAGTYDTTPGTVITKIGKDKEIISGYEVEIFRIISKSLNFTSVIEIVKNKTTSNLLQKPQEKDVDLVFSFLSLQSSRIQVLTETDSLHNDKMVLVIPPAALIDPIQKLFFTFEFLTWIAILVVMVIACVVIAVLKFLPRSYYNFVIGESIKNNYLNIWIILLGGSQSKLPSRNFARFLLMMFVIFCFVMRTLYLGSLYNLLKNEIKEKEVKTIDELIELNYDFYIYSSLVPRLIGEKLLQR